MGLNNLENRIRENKAFFDAEPSLDHLERFEARLSEIEKPATIHRAFVFTSKKTLAFAASISILLLIAVFALLEFPNIDKQPQLSQELMHVKMYYSSQTDEKFEEIRNCAAVSSKNEILFETAENRLQKLDNNTKELEKKLAQAHGNKQLESAYKQSLQAKSEIVDQIYTQMCVNNIITQ